MSRSYPAAVQKRTRSTVYLSRKAKQAEREQRAFDRAARRLVSWGRSR